MRAPAVDRDRASKRSRSRSGPSPPFTTSTLQQEANRKLGFSAERTMQIAQRLFQGMDLGGGDLEGLISYHRTDSTTLSEKALGEAGQAVDGDVRRRLSQGPAPVPDQGPQRAGSARGDPPDRLPPHAAVAREHSRERRAAASTT